MKKPIVLTVDDDPEVLHAITRDIRSEYGDRFRVIRVDSGGRALDVVRQFRISDDAVALLLADQRMPEMTGVEFLREAREIVPDAKRALLTAYADTEAAIRAINDVHLDYYLIKPWDPPEQNLYPVLDDLLDDWLANYVPAFDGIRVLGHRWSPLGFELRYFLSRNLVPYQWLDVEQSPDAQELLLSTGLDETDLPVLLFPDGAILARPPLHQIAEKIGLRTHAELPFYDLIIVGGGPAGLAGAVYGSSEGLRTLVIEREAPGGQAGTSSRIENYLGFPAGLSGADLARRGVAQARRLGAEFLTGEVAGLRLNDNYKIITLADGSELSCLALLIATGVQYRRLEAPGIERLNGAGVYYGGALSEAIATRGEDVFIAGGANSAGQAAMHFSRYARQVTIIVRGNDLRKGMSQYLVDQITATPNIRVWLGSEIAEAIGGDHLEALCIFQRETGKTDLVPAQALFIFIGARPETDWVADLLAVDQQRFLLTGPDLARGATVPRHWPLRREPFWLEASVPGIFVAGDVRHRSMKRIASATGEGAMAIHFIHQYLGGL